MSEAYKGMTQRQYIALRNKMVAENQKKEHKRNTGIYRKYRVSRTDGSSRKGKKHYGCSYFVLDLNHDKFAKVALAAYAAACQSEYPALARDLRNWVFKELGEGKS
jgi:hypothetical protein